MAKNQIFTRPESAHIKEWKAATVRVQWGDRWLSENVSPDYDVRINPNTLDLSHGSQCICGQTFKRGTFVGSSYYADGFDYAVKSLLDEANHWVSKIVGAPTKTNSRRAGVAVALGFLPGSVSSRMVDAVSRVFKPTDCVCVGYDDLQQAWLQLLAYKAAQRKVLTSA